MRYATIVLAAALLGCASDPFPGPVKEDDSPPLGAATWDRYGRTEQQAERDEVAGRVWQKDWDWWYGAFRSEGYAHDEAAYKANQVMGP